VTESVSDAEVAYNGSEGIEKARVFHPDVVVICDIGLPEMDGHEVARRMRADPELADVRLIALTLGMDGHEVARRMRADPELADVRLIALTLGAHQD
jgi:CheY-like chemotaxis protein